MSQTAENVRSEYPISGKPVSGNSDICTRNYLDRLFLEQRHIGSAKPDTKVQWFGETFSTPIMAGGMSPLKRVRPEGTPAYARAAKAAGTVCWTGMLKDEEYDEVLETGARCIRIIKPFANHDLIFQAIDHDVQKGAFAFSMDIDHVFTNKGEFYEFGGTPLGTQSVNDLREYAAYSSLPFIVKGVLSVSDAVKCAEAGAAGIVVSHHQNMFPWSVPPLKILPEIVKQVGNSVMVFVDCGMISGIDVYKAMALGADGVCIARRLREAFAEGGEISVLNCINSMTEELAGAMARTGVDCVKNFDPTVLLEV